MLPRLIPYTTEIIYKILPHIFPNLAVGAIIVVDYEIATLYHNFIAPKMDSLK
jgi:hypothetical protein